MFSPRGSVCLFVDFALRKINGYFVWDANFCGVGFLRAVSRCRGTGTVGWSWIFVDILYSLYFRFKSTSANY